MPGEPGQLLWDLAIFYLQFFPLSKLIMEITMETAFTYQKSVLHLNFVCFVLCFEGFEPISQGISDFGALSESRPSATLKWGNPESTPSLQLTNWEILQAFQYNKVILLT